MMNMQECEKMILKVILESQMTNNVDKHWNHDVPKGDPRMMNDKQCWQVLKSWCAKRPPTLGLPNANKIIIVSRC
jgi:hypothetical protein